jgi:hypothetical protein
VHDNDPGPEHEGDAGREPMSLGTRTEGGPWSTAASLLALALIGLMLLHACMSTRA